MISTLPRTLRVVAVATCACAIVSISLGFGVTGAVDFLPKFSGYADMSRCAAGEIKADPETRELADLIDQFQRVESLTFLAQAELVQFLPFPDGQRTFAVPLGTPVSGYLEYWAADERYRVNSYAEPDKFPGMQTQVAYDGRKFQLLLSSGVLSYSAQDTAGLVPVLPNPLLELLQFRYPLTDDNAHLILRLKDVRNDKVPPEFFRVEWVRVEDGSRSLERAVFPGGTFMGIPYVHHVYAVAGSRNMPVRIDRVTEGRVVSSAEFSDYDRLDTARGPTFWPRRVVLREFTSDGQTAAEMSFALSHLAVDVELEPEDFTISPESAVSVWDSDRREFVTFTRE